MFVPQAPTELAPAPAWLEERSHSTAGAFPSSLWVLESQAGTTMSARDCGKQQDPEVNLEGDEPGQQQEPSIELMGRPEVPLTGK